MSAADNTGEFLVRTVPARNRSEPIEMEIVRVTKKVYSTTDINRENPLAYEVSEGRGADIIQASNIKKANDTFLTSSQVADLIRTAGPNTTFDIPLKT